MAVIGQAVFKTRYEAAFYGPWKGYPWRSLRGKAKWIDLEVLVDLLGGPLYSIAESGGCGYIYSRMDHYFAEVIDPDSFFAALRRWHEDLVVELSLFNPASNEEAEDASAMHGFVSEIWSLAEAAYLIEQERWDTTHQ